MNKKNLTIVLWVVAVVALFSAAYTVYSKNFENGNARNFPQQDLGTGNSGGNPEAATDQKVKALDFTVEDLNGKQVKLSDYKGKVVILNFWATWCPPCRAEMPDLNSASKELDKGEDAVILAIDLTDGVRDTEDKVRAFVKDNNISMHVLLDKGTAVADAYGIESIPTTFVINKDGTVYGKRVGPISKEEIFNIVDKIK